MARTEERRFGSCRFASRSADGVGVERLGWQARSLSLPTPDNRSGLTAPGTSGMILPAAGSILYKGHWHGLPRGARRRTICDSALAFGVVAVSLVSRSLSGPVGAGG